MSQTSPEIARLADEIEASDGLYCLGSGHQLGIKKTAQVVAALRSFGGAPTPIMRAAENAAKVIEGWSDAKREYAQRAIGAVSKVVSSRDDLGNVHFVLLSEAIITALSDTSTDRAADGTLEALKLAEDVLSRAPFSTYIWPNGMHPQRGINQIREAISKLAPPSVSSPERNTK